MTSSCFHKIFASVVIFAFTSVVSAQRALLTFTEPSQDRGLVETDLLEPSGTSPDLSSSRDIPNLVGLLGDASWYTRELAQQQIVQLLKEAELQTADSDSFVHNPIVQQFLTEMHARLLEADGNPEIRQRGRSIAVGHSYAIRLTDWALKAFASFPDAQQTYAVGRTILGTSENERAAYDLATGGRELIKRMNHHFSDPDRSFVRHAAAYLPQYGFELTELDERWADYVLRNLATGALYSLTAEIKLGEENGEALIARGYELSILIAGEYSVQELISADLATIALLFGNLTPAAFSAPPVNREARVHPTKLPKPIDPSSPPTFMVKNGERMASVALGGPAINFDGSWITPLRQQIHYDLADLFREYHSDHVDSQIQFESPEDF